MPDAARCADHRRRGLPRRHEDTHRCDVSVAAVARARVVLDLELRPIAIASVTLGAAVGTFGFVFGVGTVAAGGSVLQACAMSLLVFTGASQFSAVSVIDGGGSTASALGSGLLLAARNSVYGLTMARHLDGSLGRRMIAAQLVIDESTAMSTSQSTSRERSAAFWMTGLSVFVFWNIGTLIGALVGTSINPQTFGLDAAFPAGFVAMVAPHFRHSEGRKAGVLGALICVALIPFTPIGVPILCAATAVLVGVRQP